MTEQLLRLPEKPGTVIAIGSWWLVRLRPYEDTAESAWELLPMPSKSLAEHAKRLGVKTQCIYGDDWVLAEAEQEGGYLVIADPREEPSGIQYFKPVPAMRSIEYVGPPVGERVQERANPTARGTLRHIGRNGYVDVEWDDGVWTTIEVGALEPEGRR